MAHAAYRLKHDNPSPRTKVKLMTQYRHAYIQQMNGQMNTPLLHHSYPPTGRAGSIGFASFYQK
jgi:hypothetical protein